MSRFTLVVIILAVMLSSKAAVIDSTPKDKVIKIAVNQYSQVFIGRDTLTIADLSKELETRLWRNYLGTGKTYDAIVLNFTDGVSQPVRLATIAAIRTAQTTVLNNISLQKNDKIYEDLPADKQQRLRKQFPALFQAF